MEELIEMETCNPGERVIQAAMVPRSSMRAYMILDEVEFLQEGQALQQREQAALPQQQASCKTKTNFIRETFKSNEPEKFIYYYDYG